MDGASGRAGHGPGTAQKSAIHLSPSTARPATSNGDDDDVDGPSHRIAHTLTACTRCRHRKTRCDPTLPRCLPCERSGSICEYFDTTRGKNISRYYVVRLQDKVKQLEAELSQYTEDGEESLRDDEDLVRPGGLVRLSEADATPRYLGPSSGIAMTRLLMEQAKKYTDSNQISELIPEVRARRAARMTRMHSVASYGASISGPSPGSGGSKKSFPMMSAHPAQALPTRQIAERLVDVFNKRAQYFTPTLHEVEFRKDFHAVYEGDTDPHKNFILRMVLAISLQKLDPQYAGLADSYYLAALQQIEAVVRSKDLKTLQCLVLIGLYSLLTPTRTATYHVIGLATRICQQLGLTDEASVTAEYAMGLIDPLELDMRRRMSWIVIGNEYGLAQAMGRPNGFAKTNDFVNVNFFANVDDTNITRQGIMPGPPDEKKLVAIHFCRMRIRQAEIKRMLYEKKKAEPRNDSSPILQAMEQKVDDWLTQAPGSPIWCRPWFTGRYHTMIISIHRPSPQISRPSSRSALKCYDSAVFIINLSNQQVTRGAIDVTWVFLLTLNMSLNVIIWAVSYLAVREAHTKEEVDEIIQLALDVVDQCSARWPGTRNSWQLYSTLAKACLQSYGTSDDPHDPDHDRGSLASPPLTDVDSMPEHPAMMNSGNDATWLPQLQQQKPMFRPPFGHGSDLEPPNTFGLDPNHPQQPTFRSNSIFNFPPVTAHDIADRRPSYSHFSPDSKESESTPRYESSTPPAHQAQPDIDHPTQATMAGNVSLNDQLPSARTGTLSPPLTEQSSYGISPPNTALRVSPQSLPLSSHNSPQPIQYGHLGVNGFDLPQSQSDFNGQVAPNASVQTSPVPYMQQDDLGGPNMRQRPAPQVNNGSDWYIPQAAYDPPLYDNHGDNVAIKNPFTEDVNLWSASAASDAAFGGLNLGGGDFDANFLLMNNDQNGLAVDVNGRQGGLDFTQSLTAVPPYMSDYMGQRHGSLSEGQQAELMGILESDGLGDINTYMGMDLDLGKGYQGDGISMNGNSGWS